MGKKRKSPNDQGTDAKVRSCLPSDLEKRLQLVWQQLGHLVDWCASSEAWMQLFLVEARPFRETFYWEAVGWMVSQYTREHSAASSEDTLTDCLIATQCPPSSDDRAALRELYSMWQEILRGAQAEIDAVRQSDMELSKQEGNYEKVAAMYAADEWAGEKQ